MKSQFEPIEVKRFGQTSSKDLNKMSRDIDHDLHNISSKINESKAEFSNILKNIKAENIYMEQLINDMNSYEEHGSQYINFYDKSSYDYNEGGDHEISSYRRAEIYSTYSAAHAATYNKLSKTYYKNNDDEIIIPSDLSVNIDAVDVPAGVSDFTETNKLNAIDQDIKTTWYQEYVYNDTSINSVSISYEINLPLNIFTNMQSNALVINPYPNSATDIDSIEYKLNNQSDYKEFSQSMIETDVSSNKLMIFDPMDIVSLKVTFTNSNPIDIDNGNQVKFVVGAKNIALYDYKFKENSSFAVNLKTEGVSSIDNINFNTLDNSNIEYTIYGVNKTSGALNEIEIGDTISNNYNEDFVILIDFVDITNKSPVIKGVFVEYTSI